MDTIFREFHEKFTQKIIEIKNTNLDEIIRTFSLYLFTQKEQISDFKLLFQKAESKIMFITEHIKNESKYNFFDDFYIVCFDRTIILINRSNIGDFLQFFSETKDINIFNLSKYIIDDIKNSQIEDCQEIIDQFAKNEINSKTDPYCTKEIESIINNFSIIIHQNMNKKNKEKILIFWYAINRCISGFLLKKSYLNTKYNRVNNYRKLFESETEEKEIGKDDYIILRSLSSTKSYVYLIYHIKEEQIKILKMFIHDQDNKYFKRERNNYFSLHHPLIPRYFGTVQHDNYNCLIIEYLHSYKTLNDLPKEGKIKVAFQIMHILEYLHHNGFIYRDLKPNNLIINENNSVFLIDFDRLVKDDVLDSYDDSTHDFAHEFNSPEIKDNKPFTNKADIYSLGMIMEIIFEKELTDELKEFIKRSKDEDENKRPNISEWLDFFYHKYFISITKMSECESMKLGKNVNESFYFLYWFLMSEFDNSDAQCFLGKHYHFAVKIPRDINKAIHYYKLAAQQNNMRAQYFLGELYYFREYIPQNIDLAIHYFTLSAEQNDIDSLFQLGVIYSDGNNVPIDMQKAIHYFTLSANQNNPAAQFNLGTFYEKGISINRNINKAIHYYSLASDQNFAPAQNNLGMLYLSGKDVPRNIEKAIHYFTLAANQNVENALFVLGLLYESDECIPHDINKAIDYFTRAINNGDINSHFYLGKIYYYGEFVPRDIKKAIYHFTISAQYNNPRAQNYLGIIYFYGEYAERDIDKSIHYFKLAANQNDSDAQNNLGALYEQGIYLPRDIEKAQYYFQLSANQNNLQGITNLGHIYLMKNNVDKALQYIQFAASKNNPYAQVQLGFIYHFGIYVPLDISKAEYYYKLAAKANILAAYNNLGSIYEDRDINKALYYYTLAANQNCSQSELNIGSIYYDGKYVSRDINKAIHFFTLAAKHNNNFAQYYLGIIYYNDIYVPRDINKAIYYFTLSANDNNRYSQYYLGIIFFNGKYIEPNINKSLLYMSLSAKQDFTEANFFYGVLHCHGVFVVHDFDKAISYYKNSSSFNHQFSKNNLGIIYKYVKESATAIEYFNEAIKKNDPVSMFNLAHIYFYGELSTKINIDKSIELLINSTKNGFIPSKFFLSLVIASKISNFTIESIAEELNKQGDESSKMAKEILDIIKYNKFDKSSEYEKYYLKFKDVFYCYDVNYKTIKSPSYYLPNKYNQEQFLMKDKRIDISQCFYEGFTL